MKIKKFLKYIPIIFIIFGVLMFIYPIISNYIAKKEQVNAIYKYNEAVKKQEGNYEKDELNKAEDYNKNLIGINTIYDPFSNKEKPEIFEDYNNILNIDGLGIMGYIEIPKIGIKLPIYHGTDDKVMKKRSWSY